MTSKKDLIKHSLTIFLFLLFIATVWLLIYLIWFYESPGNKKRPDPQIGSPELIIDENNETLDRLDSDIDDILTDLEILEGLIGE